MQPTLDPERVQDFAGKLLGDLGATISAALIHVGDRLGLYRALAQAGPLDSAELARRTGTSERYVREWLANQCASGYLEYDPGARTYLLPDEHAAVLADEDGPAFMAGGFETAVGVFQVLDKVEAAFRSDAGVDWGEHDARMFCGVERFFAPTYRHRLVQEWLPALSGVRAKLEAGAKVADVGCGHGRSAVLIAQAYPATSVVGIDVHADSIATATERARQAGVADRARFEQAGASEYSERDFDLIAFFDCLHDMGDPQAAAAHAFRALREDGTLMLVEPMAGDRLEENLNPVGRAYYGFSTTICTPASLAQHGRCGLGAQAGEARLREILTRAGFRTVRRVAETPFNLILEARR
jgi:SAM-dependent methyltransferase